MEHIGAISPVRPGTPKTLREDKENVSIIYCKRKLILVDHLYLLMIIMGHKLIIYGEEECNLT